MNTQQNKEQDQQDQQEQDQIQFLKEWHERAAAKFAADAAKARAWRVLRHRHTAIFNMGA